MSEAHAPEEKIARPRKKAQPVSDLPQPPPAKIKTTVELSWEAHEKLSLHALKTKKSRSEILEGLVLENCRRFYLSDRGGQAGNDEAA